MVVETGRVNFCASFLYDLRQAMKEQKMWHYLPSSRVRPWRSTIFIDYQHEKRTERRPKYYINIPLTPSDTKSITKVNHAS